MKQHKISLIAATLSSMNIMIGSGILIGPGVIAAIAGNGAFITWLIVATIFLPIVLSTVQMARMNPGPGGFYSYAKAGLNRTAGFWSGLLYATGYTFALAVTILALRQILFEALGVNWAWLMANPLLFNVVLVTILIGVNLLGLKQLTQILSSLTIWKMVPIISLILLLPFIIDPNFTVTSVEVIKLPYSLPMALFGFLGFEYACSISHQIENSERNAPLAILISFTVTALLYTLFTFGVLNLMGPAELAEKGASMFAEYITLPVPYLKVLLRIVIPTAAGITIFATSLGLLNANSSLVHSMAQKRLFYGWELLAKESRLYRPWVTIMLIGSVACLIATCLPSFDTLGNLCNSGVFLSFVLPFVSLIVLQKKAGKYAQVPLTVAALILVLCLVSYSIYSLGDTLMDRLYAAIPFLALLGAGALLYRGEKAVSKIA